MLYCFRYQKVQIGIALSVRMRYHVDRHTIYGDVDISAVVNIKPTKKNLLSFTSTRMLTDNESGYTPEQLLRGVNSVGHDIYFGEEIDGVQLWCDQNLIKRYHLFFQLNVPFICCIVNCAVYRHIPDVCNQ